MTSALRHSRENKRSVFAQAKCFLENKRSAFAKAKCFLENKNPFLILLLQLFLRVKTNCRLRALNPKTA
jgi:hypothetical protein